MSTAGGGASLSWATVPGWTAAMTTDGEALIAVTCRGTTCLAVSGSPTPATSIVSHVYRSTNGGTTWSETGTLPPAAGTTRLGGAVACDTSGHCLVVGPTGGMWRSTDDGGSWQPIVPPGTSLGYTAVACPATDTCLATGLPATASPPEGVVDRVVHGVATPVTVSADAVTALACGSSASCLGTTTTGGVFQSTDQGIAWHQTGTLPKNIFLSTLSCMGPKTCLGLSAQPLPGRAVRTATAGATWKMYSLGFPGTADDYPRALSCIPSACTAVGKAALFMSSNDGGVQWATRNAVPPMTTLGCTPSSEAHTCLGGGMSVIGRSVTEGRFWTPALAADTINAAYTGCPSLPTCIEIGGQVLLSSDSGVRWTQSTPIGGPAGPTAAECLSASYCVAAANAAVYTTLDGTVTWKPSSVPGGPKLSGISCPSTTVCYGASSLPVGTVYKGTRTVDPAHPDNVTWTWTARLTGAESPLNALSCPTTKICVAVGDAGTIVRSTDGGSKWVQTVTGGGTGNWKAVACHSAQVCAIGGVAGGADTGHAMVGSTQDAGQTWGVQNLPQSNVIDAISCPSVTSCVASGLTTGGGPAASQIVYTGKI